MLSRLVRPLLYFCLRFIFCVSIALLQEALELLALAVDLGKIVVRELAPLLFDLALEHLPVTFDAVPISCERSFVGGVDCLLGENYAHLVRMGSGPHDARSQRARP